MPPAISVVIPVYQETATITATIEHLSRMNRSEQLEIIVVDGEADSTTLHAITQPGITKLSGPKGRAVQMNQGARRATGATLLFLHADTFLPANGLAEILNTIAIPNIVGGAFNLGLDSHEKRFRLIEAAVRLRTRLFRIPYGDQAIFIKKKIFHDLGGYPNIPIMEDVALMQVLKNRGNKIAIISSPVRTSARRWKAEGVVRCTLRNWILMLLYSMGVSPTKLTRYYPAA